MDILSQIGPAAALAFDPLNVALIVLGVFLGVAMGVLPGFGGSQALALLFPFSFLMEPASAAGNNGRGDDYFGRRTDGDARAPPSCTDHFNCCWSNGRNYFDDHLYSGGLKSGASWTEIRPRRAFCR